MKVTVATLSDAVFTLEVAPDMEVENFKALCEVESGVPTSEILLLYNGQPMVGDKMTLQQVGIQDGDMVMLDRRRPTTAARRPAGAATGAGMGMFDFSQIQVPSSLLPGGSSSGPSPGPSRARLAEEDPATIREMLRANPDQMAMLKQNNPRLSEALESGDLDAFAKVLKEQQETRKEREKLRIRMMNADPFDLEAQKMIQQEIEQKNIDHNMELAMEASPESFGTVIMLYINCKVNGHDVKAFVDSGAQATIMSQAAAERCGIMRLVDQRWAGIAKGVGTQKIIGRVHMVQIQIEQDYLTSSFSILESQPMDMLLGLDMLKKHQCTIDLRKNCLMIGTTGTQTAFLTENELPPCARLSATSEEDVLKQSAKDSSQLEDRQLAEALARSASDHSMDTSEPKQGSSSAALTRSATESASTAKAASSVAASTHSSEDILPTDPFKENDVANLMTMGFSRLNSIAELRKVGGDANLAIANLFAKSLSESFNKKN